MRNTGVNFNTPAIIKKLISTVSYFQVRSQLRRQAAAHSDHVKDVVEVETSELKRKHTHEMEINISTERSAHQNEFSSLAGRVDGIRLIIRQKAELESKIRTAQELWLACKALNLALSIETPQTGIRPPLRSEVNAIQNVANEVKLAPESNEISTLERNDFVDTILKSIPK